MEQIFVAMHLACPFGATASVQAWQRIAAAITFLGRTILGVLVFCYVDDYIGVDRPECAEHAMLCMARLVRVIFGRTAVAERKLEFGPSLVALGIRISPSAQGYSCSLAEDKAAKCIETIEDAFRVGEMHPGVARKLAGRLSWASQFVFHRLGRAMLRPIFARGHSSEICLNGPLQLSLRWWLMILREGIMEKRPWQQPITPPVHLHVDARGVPPRCERRAVVWFSFVMLVLSGVQRCCSMANRYCILMGNRHQRFLNVSANGQTTRLRHLRCSQLLLGFLRLEKCWRTEE
jgi:hypothetical protein